MILVVEDEADVQKQLRKWLSQVCDGLGIPLNLDTQMRISLTELDIETCAQECGGRNEPLILIIDLVINKEGEGQKSVLDVTKKLWGDRGKYMPKVPMVIYTVVDAMDNPEPRDRNRGWVVPKYPPMGKTARGPIIAAITGAVQAAMSEWGRL